MLKRSKRKRISDSLFLLSISLTTFAGVNLSDATRDAILAMGAVALALSVWLLVTDREEVESQTDAPSGGGMRIAVLATASGVAWGVLGIAVARGLWGLAFAALLAAALVTGAIWRFIRRAHAE